MGSRPQWKPDHKELVIRWNYQILRVREDFEKHAFPGDLNNNDELFNLPGDFERLAFEEASHQ